MSAPSNDAASNDVDQVSALLDAAERGDAHGGSTDALFAALYRELHRIARRELHRGAGPMTLGATTLLHETYLDLCSRGLRFPDRPRFFAYAARAMRGLIVDHYRERRALKRGGAFEFTSYDTQAMADASAGGPTMPPLDQLADALDALALAEPALAELVELKYFCGFGLAEIAAMRRVSERTTQRHWDRARLYLRQALVDPV